MEPTNRARQCITLYEAATLLRLPPATVYHLALAGLIPYERSRGPIIIKRDCLASHACTFRERINSLYTDERRAP